MLSKCANPSCSCEFRYLHMGKLFLLKSKDRSGFSSRLNFAGHVDGIQYAWLCDQCASQYEVVIDSEEKLKVQSLYRLSGIVAGLCGAIGLQLMWAVSWATDWSSVCDLMA